MVCAGPFVGNCGRQRAARSRVGTGARRIRPLEVQRRVGRSRAAKNRSSVAHRAQERSRKGASVHWRSVAADRTWTPFRYCRSEQSFGWRDVFAVVSKYSREARAGLRGIQRNYAVLRCGNVDGVRRNGERDPWRSAGPNPRRISLDERIAGQRRRTAARQESLEGFTDAFAGVHKLADVQFGTPGTLFWEILFSGRNSGLN